MALRDDVLKALDEAKTSRGIDNPLDAGVLLGGQDRARFPDLPDVLGVSRVRYDPDRGDDMEIIDLRNEPRCDRCWRRHETAAVRSDGGMLCDRCAAAIGV